MNTYKLQTGNVQTGNVDRNQDKNPGQEKNMPEKKFRAGPVAATIWENTSLDKDGNMVKYKTVTFDRCYKDKNNAWQRTSSLRVNDLPKASLVLEKAFEYLALADHAEEAA